MKQVFDEPLEGDALRKKIFSEVEIICNDYGIDYTGGKILPRQFSFVMSEVNRRIIKPNRQTILKTNPQYNEYDLTKVDYIYNIFKDICSIYNQENSIALFIEFSGITRETLGEWASSGRSDIHKRIMHDDEQSLEQMLQDPRLNPMKILPSLNKKHGWNLPGVSKEVKQTALDVTALPELSENGAILPGPTDQ